MNQKCFDGQEHKWVEIETGSIRLTAGTIVDDRKEISICRRCGVLYQPDPQPVELQTEEIPF